tara:strand:- start:190 stop:393 length:204 start_codon:yes stop_codon:yes gene_type:complete
MRWEVKEQEDGKWGIYLKEEFWRFPDKPVLYSVSIDEHGARQRVKWMNDSQIALEEREKQMGKVEGA